MKTFKVLLIESLPIISTGIKYMISELGGYNVTEVKDIQTLTTKLKTEDADIVIIDPAETSISLPSVIHNIRTTNKDVVIAGLQTCYQNKDVLSSFDTVIEIGDSINNIRTKLTNIKEQRTETEDQNLTQREKEILVLVAKGMITKEIADTLNISEHTVVTHRKNIREKTGIKSVSGLTVYAIANHLISRSDLE